MCWGGVGWGACGSGSDLECARVGLGGGEHVRVGGVGGWVGVEDSKRGVSECVGSSAGHVLEYPHGSCCNSE